MYKIIIYSKKKIVLQLLERFIEDSFQKIETNNESGKITAIESVLNLQQINSAFKEENNIILLDCSLREEIDYLEEIIREEIDNNYKIYAHIILLNHLYNNANERLYLFNHIYLNNDINELIRTIHNILYGEEKKNLNNADNLTKRETEILILIAKGMLNKEIANELNITERTVKNHISNIFKKINVYDRTQAAVYAIKNRIYNI